MTSKMKLAAILLAGSVLLVAMASRRCGNGGAMSEIEYRGERFALRKPYSDYDEYKNSPDNLAPGQEAKLETAVGHGGLRRAYPNREELFQSVFDLKFPGYGL